MKNKPVNYLVLLWNPAQQEWVLFHRTHDIVCAKTWARTNFPIGSVEIRDIKSNRVITRKYSRGENRNEWVVSE